MKIVAVVRKRIVTIFYSSEAFERFTFSCADQYIPYGYTNIDRKSVSSFFVFDLLQLSIVRVLGMYAIIPSIAIVFGAYRYL